jgi:hypothetical protein
MPALASAPMYLPARAIKTSVQTSSSSDGPRASFSKRVSEYFLMKETNRSDVAVGVCRRLLEPAIIACGVPPPMLTVLV